MTSNARLNYSSATTWPHSKSLVIFVYAGLVFACLTVSGSAPLPRHVDLFGDAFTSACVLLGMHLVPCRQHRFESLSATS